jgi:mono/diheme cytochrome c family protein
MFKTLLILHQISVITFFLIYVIKTILLLGNKKDLLQRFTKVIKVPEMIVSFGFLATGIGMLTQIPEIKTLLIIKISIVLISIPVAIIGFKKGNKILAALSLLMITASYGLAEISRKKKAVVSNETFDENGQARGNIVYNDNCARCHGADGKLGITGASDLSKTMLDRTAIINIIHKGRGAMTPVPMSEEQAIATATYILSDIKGK